MKILGVGFNYREHEAEAVECLTEAEGGRELVGLAVDGDLHGGYCYVVIGAALGDAVDLPRAALGAARGGGSGLGYTAAPEGQMKIMEYKRQVLAFTLCLRQYYLDQVLGYNLSTAVDDGGLQPAPL